jgi:hypothetical protein
MFLFLETEILRLQGCDWKQPDALLVERRTEDNEDADGDGDVDANFPLRHSLVTNRNTTQDCEASRKVQLDALAKEFLPSATDCAEPR